MKKFTRKNKTRKNKKGGRTPPLFGRNRDSQKRISKRVAHHAAKRELKRLKSLINEREPSEGIARDAYQRRNAYLQHLDYYDDLVQRDRELTRREMEQARRPRPDVVVLDVKRGSPTRKNRRSRSRARPHHRHRRLREKRSPMNRSRSPRRPRTPRTRRMY